MHRFAAIACLLVSTVASADPDDEIRDPFDAPVLATGALVFVGSYGAAVGTATARLHAGNDQLYLPIAGPWLALGDWCANGTCDPPTSAKALLVVDGLVQAAGLVIMLDAFFEPTHHRRRASPCVQVAPKPDGLVVFGRF